MAGCRDKRLNCLEAQVDGFIHGRIRVCIHQHAFDLLASQAAAFDQVLDHGFRWFHDCCQGVAFHRHVGEHCLLFKREPGKTRPRELHDLACENPARFTLMSQTQDHVLGRARRRQFSCQTNADGARHPACDFIMFPDAGNLSVADTIRQAIQRARRAGMRIRAEDHLAGQRNFFANHGVAYARAAAGRGDVILNAGFLGHPLLAFAKIFDSGERFGGDSRKIAGEGEVIGKRMD